MNGYQGKLLFADLTEGKLWVEELDENTAKNFIGGYGIGAKVLFERMKPGTPALAPESYIGFITGPLNGTGALFGGRYTVVSKSPVYEAWNDANSGGWFGPELKKSGFDGVFVTGASEKPVYIWINDGKYELRDATELWGLDVVETEEKLKELTGEPRLRVSCIGPAGETLSHFAAVMNDGHRAAGRGGSGAVMGSKKLKAIACRGTLDFPMGDKSALLEINRGIASFVNNPPEQAAGFVNNQKKYGTASMSIRSAMSGDSPVRNWSGSGVGDFGQEKANSFDVNNYDAKYVVKPYGCAYCPFHCGAEYNVTDSKYPVGATARPEYETWAAFGCNCLCDDINAIIKCNDICNRMGYDTITAGSVVAWTMECYENGVLTKEELDGIDAKWGNGDAMVQLMEKMAADEGCGKFLKLGQWGAAKAINKGFEYLAVAGGIEPGMHDSRMPGAGGGIRSYQYDPTPGRHTKGAAKRSTLPWGPERGKVDVEAAVSQEMTNCVGLCSFSGMTFKPGTVPGMLSATFGRDYTQEQLIKDGTRIYLLRQSFNIREGYTRDKTWVSPRLAGKPAIKDGPNKDITLDPEEMGNYFYEALGCDVKTGKPFKETLEAAGALDFVIEQLY